MGLSRTFFSQPLMRVWILREPSRLLHSTKHRQQFGVCFETGVEKTGGRIDLATTVDCFNGPLSYLFWSTKILAVVMCNIIR